MDRLADRFPAVCRHQPSQRALSLSTGQTFRGERCETDNAHEADESMQKEAEKFRESLLCEKKSATETFTKCKRCTSGFGSFGVMIMASNSVITGVLVIDRTLGIT